MAKTLPILRLSSAELDAVEVTSPNSEEIGSLFIPLTNSKKNDNGARNSNPSPDLKECEKPASRGRVASYSSHLKLSSEAQSLLQEAEDRDGIYRRRVSFRDTSRQSGSTPSPNRVLPPLELHSSPKIVEREIVKARRRSISPEHTRSFFLSTKSSASISSDSTTSSFSSTNSLTSSRSSSFRLEGVDNYLKPTDSEYVDIKPCRAHCKDKRRQSTGVLEHRLQRSSPAPRHPSAPSSPNMSPKERRLSLSINRGSSMSTSIPSSPRMSPTERRSSFSIGRRLSVSVSPSSSRTISPIQNENEPVFVRISFSESAQGAQVHKLKKVCNGCITTYSAESVCVLNNAGGARRRSSSSGNMFGLDISAAAFDLLNYERKPLSKAYKLEFKHRDIQANSDINATRRIGNNVRVSCAVATSSKESRLAHYIFKYSVISEDEGSDNDEPPCDRREPARSASPCMQFNRQLPEIVLPPLSRSPSLAKGSLSTPSSPTYLKTQASLLSDQKSIPEDAEVFSSMVTAALEASLQVPTSTSTGHMITRSGAHNCLRVQKLKSKDEASMSDLGTTFQKTSFTTQSSGANSPRKYSAQVNLMMLGSLEECPWADFGHFKPSR